MKKILVGMMLAACVMLSACGSDEKETTMETTTAEATTEAAKEVALSEIYDAIAAAYGENFLAVAEMPEEMVEGTFGVTFDLMAEYVAYMPMMSVHPDLLLIAKAADGQADALEQAMITGRDNYVANAMPYPMNVAKVNATTVVRNGEYVAFLLLGAPDDSSETEDAAKAYAEAEVQKAVDAFNACFN